MQDTANNVITQLKNQNSFYIVFSPNPEFPPNHSKYNFHVRGEALFQSPNPIFLTAPFLVV